MSYPAPPLDRRSQSIRLCKFRWQDGKDMGDEDIAVTLTAVDINDSACPPWISLSYTWAFFVNYREQRSARTDATTPPRISLNGVTTSITMNLWRGLDAILQQKVAGMGEGMPKWARRIDYFWIDAICINQTDMDERSHQVSLMGLIYSRTVGVLVYLAPDIADEGETESFVEDFEKLASERQKESGKKSKTSCIAKPFVNPYWTRMWIVQEVLLAPKIVWLYENIWLIAEQLQFIGKERNLGMTAPARLLESRVAFKSGTPLDVPTLLETYQDNVCSEPKDRLYGLLGIISPDYQLEVDYKISNVELFFQVMHLERRMRKYLYHMYRLAQNLQKALELGEDLPYLIIVATVMYYEVQEAKGLLDMINHPLTEKDVSLWLVSTVEGQEVLRGDLRAPPEAFGAQLGQDMGFIPWDEHDLARLNGLSPFSRAILNRTSRPKASWMRRALGRAPSRNDSQEPWRKKLGERDGRSRRTELWIEQHSITRDLQRLTITESTYREMGLGASPSSGINFESLYASTSSPFLRRQGSRDAMWNRYATQGVVNFGSRS